MAVLQKFLLKELSYYATGGPCRFLYAPSSLAELQDTMALLHRTQEPYFLLGAGTNSLVMDEPWEGAVVSFHAMAALQANTTSLYCEAGVINSDIALLALKKNLQGLSWMYRLPGQLGATIRMNARCYGGEISQVVSKVFAVTPQGELKTYSNEPQQKNLFKGYKNTLFMNNGELIAAAEISLSKGDPQAIHAKMQFCEQDRMAKKQFVFPTCGCVFKNDYAAEVSVSSGFLLELAGVKGMQVGKAEVSSYHSNFIYNKGATSADILELSLKMREAVWQEFGVWLAYEMEILGRIPDNLAKRVLEERLPEYRQEKLARARKEFKKRLSQSSVSS